MSSGDRSKCAVCKTPATIWYTGGGNLWWHRCDKHERYFDADDDHQGVRRFTDYEEAELYALKLQL